MRAWVSQFRLLVRLYGRGLRLLWNADSGLTIAAGIITLVLAGLTPAQIWLGKLFIDEAVGVVTDLRSDVAPDVSRLLLLLAAELFLWVVGTATSSLNATIRELLGFQVEQYSRYLVLQKACLFDVAAYENPEFYNKMENAQREGGWRPLHVTWTLLHVVREGLIVAALLAILIRLSPLVALAMIAFSIPRGLVAARYARSRFNLRTSRAPERRMASYLSELLMSRDTAKEIRTFRLAPTLLARFQHLCRKFYRENRGLQFREQRADFLAGLLSALGGTGGYVFTIVRLLTGRITVGDIALYFRSIDELQSALYGLCAQGGLVYANTLSLQTFFDFLDLDPESIGGGLYLERSSKDGLEVPTPLSEGIEFRNVSFRYPGAEDFALRDVSLKIPPGQSVAIVGRNGAGKTTLVKLLVRLYDPTEGEILLEGRNLKEYDLQSLHRTFGVIFQDFIRYHLTARENISFGLIEEAENQARIESASLKAGLMEVIDKLPKGFETFLGKTLKEGVDLSYGEWQKLSLGRAFMADSEVLVLDEPTASLDAIAEHGVYMKFVDLMRSRTVVLVSHRFSTVRMADHILVLNHGHLVEQGSHAELMNRGGLYAELFEMQASRYR